MKIKQITRRDFARSTGLALFSVTGFASLSTTSCSNDDSPTTPNPTTGNGLVINLASNAALDAVGGVAAFDFKGTPIYVFRTGDATFRVLSRLCTHQACTINWQSSSTKLACPCHGSEFDAQGNVLKGPASSPLQEFAATYDANANTLTVGA